MSCNRLQSERAHNRQFRHNRASIKGGLRPHTSPKRGSTELAEVQRVRPNPSLPLCDVALFGARHREPDPPALQAGIWGRGVRWVSGSNTQGSHPGLYSVGLTGRGIRNSGLKGQRGTAQGGSNTQGWQPGLYSVGPAGRGIQTSGLKGRRGRAQGESLGFQPARAISYRPEGPEGCGATSRLGLRFSIRSAAAYS
jgi:hypothetical protein